MDAMCSGLFLRHLHRILILKLEVLLLIPFLDPREDCAKETTMEIAGHKLLQRHECWGVEVTSQSFRSVMLKHVETCWNMLKHVNNSLFFLKMGSSSASFEWKIFSVAHLARWWVALFWTIASAPRMRRMPRSRRNWPSKFDVGLWPAVTGCA